MNEDISLLRSLFASPPDVTTAMRTTLDFCRSKYSAEKIESLYQLPFVEETEQLKEWVGAVLRSEPPLVSIQAYYFGLFDSIGQDQNVRPCLHICGSELFDERDESGEWACSASYFPKGGHAISEVLVALEDAARGSEVYETELSYVLQISFAGVAVSQAVHGLPKELTLGTRLSRGLAIGFDEGDRFLLPPLTR